MEFRRTMLQAISYVLSVARQMLKEGQKNIDLVSLLRRLAERAVALPRLGGDSN
jgi:hypothetical protein